MPKPSKDLRVFLEQAKEEYRATLPEKLDSLEQWIAQLEQICDQRDIQRKMFDVVHRISGTAGSFGLDDIGNVADEWERKLRELTLRTPLGSDYSAMRNYIVRIRLLLS